VTDEKKKVLKYLGLLACLLFLASLIFPFYKLTYVTGHWFEDVQIHSTYYWSFTVQEEHSSTGFITHTFTNYWFYEHSFYDQVLDPKLSPVFILMFVAQILTLGSGVASIFVKKRILAFVPVILCFGVTMSMVYVNFVLSEYFGVGTYQAGYWLTYLSMFVFLLSPILNLVLSRRKETEFQKPESA
jgi:hypothetical protein